MDFKKPGDWPEQAAINIGIFLELLRVLVVPGSSNAAANQVIIVANMLESNGIGNFASSIKFCSFFMCTALGKDEGKYYCRLK